MTRRRLIAALAALVALAAASPAVGAPDRSGSVAAGGATFKWEGGPITGFLLTSDLGDAFECGDPGKDCDDTLINFSAGSANVTIAPTSDGSVDLDLYVYKSNAQGEAGQFVKSSAGGTSDELVTFPAQAGPYLVRVVAATATDGTYHGEAKLTAAAAKALPGEVDYGVDPADPNADKGGGGANTLANDKPPTTTVRAPRFSQSRVLSGTARDSDGKVAYVDVALVRLFSKSCKALTAAGTWRTLRKCSAPPFLRARGTTKWHYTMRRRLAKGRYVVFARATDNLGRREGGFGPKNRIRFRIT